MIATTQQTLRPIIRWAGNKYGTPVADRVAELFKPYRSTHLYVDPFAGAGGMLLYLKPEKAILGDYSREMIALHKWIKNGGSTIPEHWPVHEGREQFKAYRYQFRLMQSKLCAGTAIDNDRFCTHLLWLNYHCFNGLWRSNQKGLFNAPGGRNSKKVLLNRQPPNLSQWTKVYNQNNWQFFCTDFEGIDDYVAIDSWTNRCKGQFVYVDPPYWGTHSKYSANGFEWDDQVRLADWLAAKNGPVVASNSSHPDIVEMYRSRGFEVEMIEVRRSMSPNGNRTPAIEMLAYRNV